VQRQREPYSRACSLDDNSWNDTFVIGVTSGKLRYFDAVAPRNWFNFDTHWNIGFEWTGIRLGPSIELQHVVNSHDNVRFGRLHVTMLELRNWSSFCITDLHRASRIAIELILQLTLSG
jgi:hypothetical protein